MITKDNRCFRELLEILSQQTKIEYLENLEVLKELVKGYKDSYITAHLLTEYNRISFVRLMRKYINTFDIYLILNIYC